MSVNTAVSQTFITSNRLGRVNVTSGGRNDTLVTLLWDTLGHVSSTTPGYYCRTREEIVLASHSVNPTKPFRNVPEVDKALELIRDPDVSDHYGWTVPHVPRGLPANGTVYRYLIILKGSKGSLSAHDTKIVQSGMASTSRLVSTTCDRLSHILSDSATTTLDPTVAKWCRDTASVLAGISTQAELEANRVEQHMAKMAKRQAAKAKKLSSNGSHP